MPSSILEYLNRRTNEVTAVADQTFFRLLESTAPIESAIPINSYASRELLVAKVSHNRMPIARILAPGEELKATKPQMTLIEAIAKNVKLGQKLVYTEPDYELMHRLQMQASIGGAAGQAATQAIEQYFFGNVANLVPSVYDASLVLGTKIAVTGNCNYTDPLTGNSIAISYSPPSGNMIAPLTGNARWSQPATCTPLANLEAHAKAYYNLIGRWPDQVVMGWQTLRYLAEATDTKTSFYRRAGGSAAAAPELYVEDDQAADLIKTRTRCNSVLLFDAQYTNEDSAGNQTNSYFLPPDYYFFTQPDFIERAFVPTVERDFEPGLFQISDVESRLPRVEYSAIAGAFIPYVKDERFIAAANVNNTAVT